MFAETMGNLFKGYLSAPEPRPTEVHAGGMYRHSGPGNVVETAEVIDVGPDAMGIPHVRFEVLVDRSRERHTHFQAIRTLNLETFRDYFTEAMPS